MLAEVNAADAGQVGWQMGGTKTRIVLASADVHGAGEGVDWRRCDAGLPGTPSSILGVACLEDEAVQTGGERGQLRAHATILSEAEQFQVVGAEDGEVVAGAQCVMAARREAET